MSSSGTHPLEKRSLNSVTHCGLAHAGTQAKLMKLSHSIQNMLPFIKRSPCTHEDLSWLPSTLGKCWVSSTYLCSENCGGENQTIPGAWWPAVLPLCSVRPPSQKLKVWCDGERHLWLQHTHAHAPAHTHAYTWEHTHQQQQKSSCLLCRVWHCRRRSTVRSLHPLLITTRNLQHCTL